MKLTKEKIEQLASDVYAALHAHGADNEIQLFYNNKKLSKYSDEPKIIEGVHPLDYCDYAPEKNILTITSEGVLYDIYDLEYGMPRWLEVIWEREGLYCECNEAWNWSLYPVDDRYDEIEYDVQERDEEEYIYNGKDGIPAELQMIMDCWYHASAQTGDVGCCVIGEGMCFNYKDKKYKMAPASPFQGEGSWSKWVPMIKEMLKAIGATEIDWKCGRLD